MIRKVVVVLLSKGSPEWEGGEKERKRSGVTSGGMHVESTKTKLEK